MTALVAVFAGLLGAAFGSFANVVVHRVPRGVSLASPPSACPACGTRVSSRDNIPVVSYVLLRGRCRACRVRISARYPLVEAATATLWVAAALLVEGVEAAAFTAAASTVLLVLAAIDIEHRRVPNVIVVPATLAAVVWVGGAAVARGTPGMLLWALGSGAALFLLLFFVAAVTGGMGYGDVKLAAFIGVVTGRFGPEIALVAAMAAFIGGGLVALALVAGGVRDRKDALPFAPALAGGALLALLAGEPIAAAWLRL